MVYHVYPHVPTMYLQKIYLQNYIFYIANYFIELYFMIKQIVIGYFLFQAYHFIKNAIAWRHGRRTAFSCYRLFYLPDDIENGTFFGFLSRPVSNYRKKKLFNDLFAKCPLSSHLIFNQRNKEKICIHK